MKIFKDDIKCKDCLNNVNNMCLLFNGKDVNEEDAGCGVGIDKFKNHELIGDEWDG